MQVMELAAIWLNEPIIISRGMEDVRTVRIVPGDVVKVKGQTYIIRHCMGNLDSSIIYFHAIEPETGLEIKLTPNELML